MIPSTGILMAYIHGHLIEAISAKAALLFHQYAPDNGFSYFTTPAKAPDNAAIMQIIMPPLDKYRLAGAERRLYQRRRLYDRHILE